MRRAAWALVLCACAGPEPGREPLPPLRRDAFERSVQGILQEHCANPTCHGNDERPFSLYAPMRHRQDPRMTFSEEPLREREISHNFIAASLMVVGAPSASESLLVRKPLAEAAGTYHGGGAVLDGRDERLRAIVAWIEGKEAP